MLHVHLSDIVFIGKTHFTIVWWWLLNL